MKLDISGLCKGNPEAMDWIDAWGTYLRECDDTVDDGKWSAENVMNTFALGCRCYSHPFYRKHAETLHVAALTATSLWTVSVDWERETELWKRQWADVLRHADICIVFAVGMICGDWTHAQTFVRAGLAASYIDHKDRHGVPE